MALTPLLLGGDGLGSNDSRFILAMPIWPSGLAIVIVVGGWIASYISRNRTGAYQNDVTNTGKK